MERKDVKRLLFILQVYYRSTRHEQFLFKSELGSNKDKLSWEDLEYINEIRGSLENLLYDLNQLCEEKEIERPYQMADDCFDRFGY